MTDTSANPRAAKRIAADTIKAATVEIVAKKTAQAAKQQQKRDAAKAKKREAAETQLVERCRKLNIILPDDIEKTEDGRIFDTLDNAYKILAAQAWGFGFDELAQEHVFRGAVVWPAHYGNVLTDKLTLAIRLSLIDVFGVEFSTKQVEESLMALCNANPFNPVTEYLDRIQPTWDGKKRVEKWIHNYLGAPDDAYTSAVGAVFLVGAVARARNPGCKFDTMPILEGPQGSGKSTALKILGGDYYSDAELGNLKDKDAAMVLRGVWIMEIPELASLRRADMNTLKAFVTRQVDRYRPTRANLPINQPRGCVFVGTYNPDGNDGYLTDASGNRRFQPVVTEKINLERLAEDRDQLWAEAAQMYADGNSTVIPAELFDKAAEEAARRGQDDPWLAKLADKADELALGEKITTRDVLLNWIGVDDERQTKADGARIGPLMRMLGFDKAQIGIGKRCVRGWKKLPEAKAKAA